MKQILLIAVIIIKIGCVSDSETKKQKKTKELEINLSNTNKSIDSLQKNENTIDYKNIIKDEYWKRGNYYTSQRNQEEFFHVRVCILDNKIMCYFMGVVLPVKSDVIYANIYELNEDKEIYLIDSIKLKAFQSTEIVSDEFHCEDFMLRNLDNLFFNDDKLYYFEESDYPNKEDSYSEIVSKRDYYEYELGSRKTPQQTDEIINSHKLFFGWSAYRSVINHKRTIIATTDNYLIYFNQITDWEKTYNDLFSDQNVDIYDYMTQLPKVDFNFTEYFKPPSEDDEYGVRIDTDNGNEIFFGGMCWHSEKDILYFDNSGFDYRCIWEADIEGKKINKIVPEHEAIHPFFFKFKNNEYVAYTEKNKIMICESPNNTN